MQVEVPLVDFQMLHQPYRLVRTPLGHDGSIKTLLVFSYNLRRKCWELGSSAAAVVLSYTEVPDVSIFQISLVGSNGQPSWKSLILFTALKLN